MWESKLFLTRLHRTIQNILLAANPSTAFLQKASWPGKNIKQEMSRNSRHSNAEKIHGTIVVKTSERWSLLAPFPGQDW